VKIGEVVAGSVRGGLEAKLQLHNPEDLRVGYPVIVEGERYDFYCLVEDVVNQSLDIAERIAGADLREALLPSAGSHEGYGGPIFYSKALLRPIQLVDKESGKLLEPQTIPPYFAEARHATRKDVERIYQPTDGSVPLGRILGVEPFLVHVDFRRLTEKPFAVFGRTGVGKSIFNKLVCLGILAKDAGSVLIFDMHGEYGVYSRTDNKEGLKYFFPSKVEVFSLDPRNKEARPFLLDTHQITPEDLVVAFQDFTPAMIDALYELARTKARDVDLIAAIKGADPVAADQARFSTMSLQALQRRMGRLDRLPFLVPGGRDAFGQMVGHIREGKSVVLDFGEFGTDHMVYLFVANLLSRRLFELYTEKNEELPRLLVFLEEAHKFLHPNVASFTIFSKLARETRKFNLILAIVDQRPSQIDDEVRSQLANRFVLSLKEPSDVESALAGVPDRGMWQSVVSTIPARTVAVIGDAIRIPTVLDVLTYDVLTIQEHIVGPGGATERRLEDVARRADEVFRAEEEAPGS
jgi:DNA helicase HerA-like ATPase